MITRAKPIDTKAYNDALHEPGVEFVDGEIREKEMSIGNARTTAKLARVLGNAVQRTHVEVLSNEAAYRCFKDDPMRFRKPDLSLVRSSSLTQIDADDGFVPFAPDLAIEVVSPNDLAYEVDRKVADYQTNGFALVWLVYPSSKSVVEYTPTSSKTFKTADELTLPELLPEFRCKVSELFE